MDPTRLTTLATGAIVLLTAIYLLVFGALALAASPRASRYLSAFASSKRLHFLELGVRLLVGGAFVFFAQRMLFGTVFQSFGWIVVITTLVLAILPWHWHQRFARKSVPSALPFLRPIGVVSMTAGALVMWSVIGA